MKKKDREELAEKLFEHWNDEEVVDDVTGDGEIEHIETDVRNEDKSERPVRKTRTTQRKD